MYNYDKNLTMKQKIENWWHDLWLYTEPFSTLRDWYYNTRNFLFRRYDLIRTGLSKYEWWDKDGLMLYGMMNLLVDYVEKEKCFEVIVWDEDEHHKKIADEIKIIYAWWKDYPERLKAIDNQLTAWHDEFSKRTGKDWLGKLNSSEKSEKEEPESEKLHKMEADLIREEEEMLIRLVKIRNYLWT